MSEMQKEKIDLLALKERALGLLRSTGKENMEAFIDYLENRTDYFTAPASTQFHGAYEGGLVDHSLAVYDNLVRMVQLFNIPGKEESLIIIALLHDLCKTNFYKIKLYQTNLKIPFSPKKLVLLQFALNDNSDVGKAMKNRFRYIMTA